LKKPISNKVESILVLHGPNLNLLGVREPEISGHESLEDINRRLVDAAQSAGADVECFQSNHEGELVDRIQQAGREGVGFIVINPAAYTHTSVAIRDALAGVKIPFVEVHLSNVHAREPFRHRSFVSDIAVGTICGLGSRGYDLALAYVLLRGQE
jgi:3-dehydroquinate dehydratase-2